MDETLLAKTADSPDITRVAVVFSSVNANGFSFYNLFEQFSEKLHRIYVRDPHDQWYDQGVSEELTSWPEVADAIRAEIEKLGATEVLTFGASMGAYAGIRFAREVDACACIAMSPQTILDGRLPHTPRDPVDQANHDLGRLLGSWQPRCTSIFFGAADFVDIYNVLRVSWQGAALYPVAEQDHLVAQFLLSKQVFHGLIGEFVETGRFSGEAQLCDKGIALDLNCFDEVQRLLINRIVEGYYLEAPWDVMTCQRALKVLQPWADGYNIEAQMLVREKDFEAAARAVSKARRLAPKSVTLSDAYADVMARAGRIDEAIDGYRRSLKLRSKHYGALCRLSELLHNNGDAEEAETLLRQAIEVRPRLPRAFTIAERLGIELEKAS
jgi:tetratricopeptide (TPR) repeat protein